MTSMKKIDLVDVINKNPNCTAVIDNDCWWIRRALPINWGEMSDDRRDDWMNESELVSSYDDIVDRGSGYGSGNTYGGDILQALAEIVGINIESV